MSKGKLQQDMVKNSAPAFSKKLSTPCKYVPKNFISTETDTETKVVRNYQIHLKVYLCSQKQGVYACSKNPFIFLRAVSFTKHTFILNLFTNKCYN